MFIILYYTPQRLATIYHAQSPLCMRCNSSAATFIQMVWICPPIRPLWESVVDAVNHICDLALMEDVEANRYLKQFYALFYAEREILIRCILPNPSTLASGKAAVNAVLPLCKLTYESRNCPKKIDKIWSIWIDAYGSDVRGIM